MVVGCLLAMACGRLGYDPLTGSGSRTDGGMDTSIGADAGTDAGVALFEGRSDVPPIGVCNEPNGTCREWIGEFFSSADLSVSCDFIEGSFTTVDCTPDDAIAVCTINGMGAGDTRRVDFFYYAPIWTLPSAEDNCSAKGSATILGTFHPRN